jgi:hypothetical protein
MMTVEQNAMLKACISLDLKMSTSGTGPVVLA